MPNSPLSQAAAARAARSADAGAPTVHLSTAPTPDHPLPVTVVDPQGPVKTARAWLQ